MSECNRCDYLEALASSQAHKLEELRARLHEKELMLASLMNEEQAATYRALEDDGDGS
jgi:hypothetical protein